jgi:hypothetical protein
MSNHPIPLVLVLAVVAPLHRGDGGAADLGADQAEQPRHDRGAHGLVPGHTGYAIVGAVRNAACWSQADAEPIPG